MSLTLGHRAASPAPLYAWTPLDLGASLIAWWDAQRSDLITHVAGAVSSWKDIVGAYDAVQATAGSKPVYSASSFNGAWGGVTFDGTDDRLAVAGTLNVAIPTGAAASELWALTSQDALVADTTSRTVFSYGGSSISLRRLERIVTTGVNRARLGVGTGAAGQVATHATADLSGRHVMRGIVGATISELDIDSVAGTPASIVPGTTTIGLSIGSSSNSASAFWTGIVSAALITLPLTTAQADQLYAYLNRRL